LNDDIENETTHAWTVIPDFVTDYLKEQKYDGIKDKGGKGGGDGHTVWIPFSSEQVKSADPVTYDDKGNVIPLSERFNPKETDIRYAEKDTAPAKKTVKKTVKKTSEQIYREQNKALMQYIKDEYNKSEKFTPRIEDVRKAANRLGKGYIGDKKLAQEIGRIYKDVKSAIAYAEKPGVTEQDIQAKWNVVQEEVDDLAMDIVMNHQEKNDANWQMIKDLRDYMRGRTIKVPAENKGDFDAQGGLEELRKHNMGRFYISQTKGESMEALYPELRGMFGNLLPDISNPSDQLIALSDLYDEMAVTFDNPYDADIEAAQQSMSLEIMADMLVNIKEVKDTKDQRVEAVNKIIETEREKRYNALKRVKDRQDRKIREAKAKAKEKAEKRLDATARQRLLAVAKRLDSLSKKSKPEQQAEIQKLIGHLDLAAVSITKRNIDKLENIKSVYEEMKLNPDFVEDKHIERLIARLGKKQISDLDLQDVQTLTDVLLGIEHKIRTDGRDIDTADKRKISIQAEETMRNIDNSSGSAAMGIGKLADNLVSGVLTPTREARRITGYVDNDPLYIKMKSMQKGQVDMFDYQMKAEKMFEKFTNDTRFMESITGAKAKTKTYKVSEKNSKGEVIGERNIELTPGMKISLLLHNINSSNQGHMKIGGVTIPNVKLYKAGKIDEAFARGEKIYLHPSDIRAITADLTTQEREYAKLVYKYYNEFAKNEVNRVSVKLKGYEIAKVKDYFPIETNRDFSRQDFELVNVDGTIEGMGFLKERTQAKNPILLRDVASILEQSIRMNSKYVGLAIPVRNMSLLLGKSFSKYGEATIEEQAVYGLNYTIEEGYYGSVMDSIEKKWGVNGKEYINKIMKDMQGAKKEQGWIEKSVERIGSRYVRGILSWNPKVAFNQVASIPSAIPEVGVKALSRSMFDFGRVNTDRIAEYTPLQYMRSKGAYDTTIADMTRAKKGPLAAIDKVVDKVDMMTWTDTIMTRKLWKAAEYNIKYSRKDLKVGSQEYYEAVAEVYVDIMQNTQPNVSMMERPQFLRGDAVTRMVMSFKGEPFKNLNMMYESAGNLRAKTRQLKQLKNNKSATAKEISEAENRLKQAKSEFAVTMISQALASLVYGIEASIFQLLYGKVKDYWDDEEEKVTFESWLVGVLKNSAINTVTQIPFADYVVDVVGSLSGGRYYSPYTPPALDSVDTATKSIPALVSAAQDIISGKINLQQFGFKAYDAIEDVSTFLGIPTANVIKNIKPVIKGVIKSSISNEYLREYAVLKTESAIAEKKENNKGEIVTKGSSEAFDILYRAMENGDEEAYNTIVKDLQDRGVSYTDIESAMQNRAKKDENFNLDTSLNMYAGVEERGETEKYEKYIDSAEELGIDEELLKKVVDAANSKKKYKERKTDAEKIINNASLDFESEEFLKNIIADSYSVNDLSKEQYIEYSKTRATYLQKVDNEIDSEGMSEREFRKVYNKASDLAEEYALSEASDGEYSMRAKWMYYAVDAEEEVGMTTGEFLKVYEEYGSTIYSTPSLITHEVGYDVSDYLEFHKLTKDIKGDKDEKGKDIKGKTKQDKIIKVLEEMNVSDEMKAYLYSTEYKSNKNNPWKRHLKVNYKEYVEEKKGE
ncbi:MAG: hypothetical protein U0L72_03870, partial [Acutalibacteraceae bacterium]|nr:hypothetical protein [Acutalibacteraceae bacterium]